MSTLKEIFAEIGHFGEDVGCNDKGSIHTYLDKYEELFAPFKDGCSIMEIGLALGHSIELFDRYFSGSDIFGIDITVVFSLKEYKNHVEIIEADATKESFLNMPQMLGRNFDIIIDDGSHMEADQVATFNLLKSRMNPGGYFKS